jgi:hypothetical protein
LRDDEGPTAAIRCPAVAGSWLAVAVPLRRRVRQRIGRDRLQAHDRRRPVSREIARQQARRRLDGRREDDRRRRIESRRPELSGHDEAARGEGDGEQPHEAHADIIIGPQDGLQ